MEKRDVVHGTFVIERSYPVAPERVYNAFADPEKKRRWLMEGEGKDVVSFEMDFRIGGREHSRSRFKEGTPFPGVVLANETTYLDLVTDRRIVLAYTMAFGESRFSASLATFELVPTELGTTLVLTEQGAYFEGADGPQIREAGWRQLLEQLAHELAR
jgi:uncharacterized protein YndB with AHSA1/START domain